MCINRTFIRSCGRIKFMKKIISIILILPMMMFAETNTEDEKHYEIIGSDQYITYKNSEDAPEILLDAKIGNLRVRHVRTKNPICFKDDPGYQHHIELDGEIGPDSTKAISKILEEIPNCFAEIPHVHDDFFTVIFLNSSGGLLEDGFRLGNLIYENYAQTVIARGQRCASACAIAFLGGNARHMFADAEILFHAPYTIEDDRFINCINPNETDALLAYYKKMIDEDDALYLFKRTMDYCSVQDGWTLNKDGADLLGLTLDVKSWFEGQEDGTGRELFNPDNS